MSKNDVIVETSKKYKDISDYPLMLTPTHVKEILGLSRKTTYDILNQIEYRMKTGKPVPFIIKRFGKPIKIPRDQFWEWCNKNDVVDLLEVLNDGKA